MSGLPVLQNQFEIRAWSRLIGGGAASLLGRARGGAVSVAEDILSHDGSIHPALLIRAMDALDSEGLLTKELLERLVSKSRAVDCTPSVHASGIMLARGDADGAEEMLSMSERTGEVLRRSIAASRICLARGDREGARRHALAAHGDDRTCPEPYEILAEVDPDGGWGVRGNIRQVLVGEQPSAPVGTGRFQDLYAIYYEWFRGRRSVATDRLISSRYYTEKDPDFLLASARMSVDERDWHSARLMFGNILDGADNTVVCEAAEADIAGGYAEEALALLLGADRTCPRVLRDTIMANAALPGGRELMESVRAYLDSEFSDLDEHLDAVRMLIGMGRRNDAEPIMARVLASWPDEPSVLSLQSSLLMDCGNVPGAVSVAKRAVRKDSKDAGARVQLARVLMATGKTEAASRECERAMGLSPKNREVMTLKKDLCMEAGDYKGAADICRMILDNDPSDTETMMSLSGAMSRLGDSEGALDIFRKAVRHDPSLENSLEVVRSLISSGMYREAVHICMEVERTAPRSATEKRLRGNAEYAMGEYMRASVSFAAAAEIDPHDPVVWHSKGMADEARGDMESAEEAYNRAVLLDLCEPEYWISKAAVQEARGDMYGAVESLNRAIELDPTSFYALVRKATIFSRSSRHAEALHYLDMALAVSPRDPDVMRLMVRVQTDAGMYREAAETGSVLLSAVSDHEVAADVARCLMKTGDHHGALDVIDGMLIRDNASVPLLEAKAEVLADAGDRGAALEVCRRLTEAQPDDAGVRMFVADIHRSLGDEASAKKIYTELEDSPDTAVEAASRKAGRSGRPEEDPESLASIASSLLAAGDLKGAMRMIDRAIATDPGKPSYLSTKARIALASDDREEAVKAANTAISMDQSDPDAHEVLGMVNRKNGDLKGAVKELERAISLGMEGAGIRRELAAIHEVMGATDRAIERYSEAVDLDPEDLDARERMAALLVSRKRLDRAEEQVSEILRHDPERASSIVLLADIQRRRGNDAQVTAAYEMFRRCRSTSKGDVARMAMVLEEAGHGSEARMLIGGKQDPAETDRSVKRQAEKVLRRAYTTRTPVDDPDIMTALGFDPSVAHRVTDYLQDIHEYGPISPGTDEFRRLEKLSHDVVMKIGWKDLEDEPQLPLEKVFVAGGFRDADSAKELVAYVFAAMSLDVGRKVDPGLTEMSMRLPKGMTVYEIMDECSLGVYEARVVQAQVV